MVQLLAVVIPALLLGSIAAGVSMLKYGKELKDDPEYLARIADGRLVVSEHHENKLVDLSKFDKTAKLSVVIFLCGMLCIVLLGVVPSLRPVLSNEKQLGMTDVIQIFMFIAAVAILLVSKKDSNLVVKSSKIAEDDNKWTCACGAVNEGKFCTQCGAKKPEKVKLYRCNKCGWVPDDPKNPPKFCPQCGDPFNESDAN